MEMSTSLRSLNSQPIRVAINRKARAMLHVSEPTIFWVMSPTSMEVPVVNTRSSGKFFPEPWFNFIPNLVDPVRSCILYIGGHTNRTVVKVYESFVFPGICQFQQQHILGRRLLIERKRRSSGEGFVHLREYSGNRCSAGYFRYGMKSVFEFCYPLQKIGIESSVCPLCIDDKLKAGIAGLSYP